ncbi:MAG: hypothetical protein KAJ42_16215, partial [Gemmatimonadetes bacterium]|nr:hypothetical protein [Gemmatimonadota bacterium]
RVDRSARAAEGPQEASDDARAVESGLGVGPSGALWPILLAVSFFTAVASFIYEIGWIRMLSLVMGGATHSFELMLSAFILGLALGALVVRQRTDGTREPLKLLGWIQWLMGLAALATIPVYLGTFDLMGGLVRTLPGMPAGYTAFAMGRYGIALAVMLPSTVLAGMTLPLITTTLLRAGHGERSIGWVYGVNTLGSVVGVAAAGLVILPWVGLKNMVVAGAGLDMVVGVVILAYAFRGRRRVPGRVVLTTAVATILACGLVGGGVHLDRMTLSSGVFRYGQVATEEQQEVLFYRDGRTATVGAYISGENDILTLATNGKPDASLSMRWVRAAREDLPPRPIVVDDESTQVLLALIPLAHHPRARTGAIIGHGSGITGHFLLGSPWIERAVTIEIEPEMISGSRVYYPANARTFDDERASFVIDDAKAYFAHRQERFDIIISEPSNPWVSGISSLFTIEFYDRIRSYLSEDGVFAQWLHLYELSDELAGSVLAAIHTAFPSYRGYLIGPGDLLIVAGATPELSEPDWSVFHYPDIVEGLSHVVPITGEHLSAMALFDRRDLAPLLDEWDPVNSDFRPVLDLGAERSRFDDDFALGVYSLGRDRIDVLGVLAGRRRGLARDWGEPILGLAPLGKRGISSWLRVHRSQPELTAPPPSDDHEAAWTEYRSFSEVLDGDDDPADWAAFTAQMASVEAELHGRSTATIDTLFYRRIFDFVARHEAPLEARAVVDFLFGTAIWDFRQAAGAAEILIEAAARGEEWIDMGQLLDGAVVSMLGTGDPERAAAAMEVLVPRTGRGSDDFRTRLLRAAIESRLPGGG